MSEKQIAFFEAKNENTTKSQMSWERELYNAEHEYEQYLYEEAKELFDEGIACDWSEFR